jgi:hypothetical protein
MLKLPNGVTLPDESDPIKLPVVVTDVTSTLKENVSHLKCFNTRVYTYTFGADLGQLVVSFAGFLTKGVQYNPDGGGKGGGSSDVMSKFLSNYNESRISASKDEAILHLGTSGEVIRGQVVEFRTATQNLDGNIQRFQLVMTVVPRPDKAAGSDSSGGGGGGAAPPSAGAPTRDTAASDAPDAPAASGGEGPGYCGPSDVSEHYEDYYTKFLRDARDPGLMPGTVLAGSADGRGCGSMTSTLLGGIDG